MPVISPARRATISKWATAGAWFFIAFSLVSVGWALAQQWADPSGTTRLYGDVGHGAWGLTYAGVAGLLLALVQMITVGASALLSTMPRTRWGRIGRRVLAGWAALWWLNLIWLASVQPGLGPAARAAFMTVLFAAVAYRGLRRLAIEPAGPPTPEPSIRLRAKNIAQHARPAADAAGRRLRSLLAETRPAFRSFITSTRRGLSRLQSRVQNGWGTKST